MLEGVAYMPVHIAPMQYEQENMIYFSASISDFALLTIRSYDEASA